MTFAEIEKQINHYKVLNRKMFLTSSFQTHSVVLLHIISRIDNQIPIYFNNTGYHFPDTIEYKERISELLNLNIIDIHSCTPKNLQKDYKGNLLFTSDPDFCCHLNKVQPVELLLKEYDVWINGVRADQSEIRKAMNIEEMTPFKAMRFHPMLDWNSQMIFDYLNEFNLPHHPLDAQGYVSIGCEPCTRKAFDGRAGRWYGLNKTECGLNSELLKK